MTPEKALEALLVERIQGYNFESSRVQVVPQHQSDKLAVLPRIVVVCSLGQDAALATAGLFPVNVEVTVAVNAMDSSDNYLLDPLIEAVDATLSAWSELEDFRVRVFGGTLGQSSSLVADDRFERTISAVLWAAAD